MVLSWSEHQPRVWYVNLRELVQQTPDELREFLATADRTIRESCELSQTLSASMAASRADDGPTARVQRFRFVDRRQTADRRATQRGGPDRRQTPDRRA